MPPEAVNMRPSVCFGHRMFLRKQCGPQGEAPYRCGREWVGGARVLPSVGSQGCWRRQGPAQSEAALTAVNKHQTWAGGINHRTLFLSLWSRRSPPSCLHFGVQAEPTSGLPGGCSYLCVTAERTLPLLADLQSSGIRPHLCSQSPPQRHSSKYRHQGAGASTCDFWRDPAQAKATASLPNTDWSPMPDTRHPWGRGDGGFPTQPLPQPTNRQVEDMTVAVMEQQGTME